MLVIHWSPVKNTRRILRNGIQKGERGLFCFPLTGHPSVDRWWAKAFRAWRPRTQYNGFIFRLEQEDFPARFGHWIGSQWGAEKDLHSLEELETEFRNTLVWRLGEAHAASREQDNLVLGEEVIRRDPEVLARLRSDPKWLLWVYEDNEIVLSRSIDARRIIRTVSGSHLSGRQRLARHRTSFDTDF